MITMARPRADSPQTVAPSGALSRMEGGFNVNLGASSNQPGITFCGVAESKAVANVAGHERQLQIRAVGDAAMAGPGALSEAMQIADRLRADTNYAGFKISVEANGPSMPVHKGNPLN